MVYLHVILSCTIIFEAILASSEEIESYRSRRKFEVTNLLYHKQTVHKR
jgi:hypothetical protein